jgi:lipoyl(octanoyl) transferase
VAHLGTLPYRDALALQRELRERRVAGELPDVLLLLEHPPVYTRGRRSDPSELALGEDFYRARGIEVVQTDRGGRVTYHGPGQLVGYPIVAVSDVIAHVRAMERAIVAALADFGVQAHSRCAEGPDYTGVWVAGGEGPNGARAGEGESGGEEEAGEDGQGAETRSGAETQSGSDPIARKIASIGVHVSRGVSTHGFAVNVNNDLAPFDWIVACGLPDVQMTSLARELARIQEAPPADRALDPGAFRERVARRFCEARGRAPLAVTPEELGISAHDLALAA